MAKQQLPFKARRLKNAITLAEDDHASMQKQIKYSTISASFFIISIVLKLTHMQFKQRLGLLQGYFSVL